MFPSAPPIALRRAMRLRRGLEASGRPSGPLWRRAGCGRMGFAIVLATTLWLSGTGLHGDGGVPWNMLLVLWGALASLAAARLLGQRPTLALLIGLTAAPLLIASTLGRGLIGDGPLGYANASAALYFLSATAALLLARRSASTVGRILSGGTAVLWIVFVWLTGSHAAAILASCLLIAAVSVRGRKGVRKLLLGGGLVLMTCLLVTVVLGATHDPGPRAGTLDRVVDATLGDLRLLVWDHALDLVWARPLTGVGPGQYRNHSELIQQRPAAEWVHNEYLQAAAETGIVGLALLMALLLWAASNLWNSPCPSCATLAAAALLGVGIHATIDYVLHFSSIVIVLALLLGTSTGQRHHGASHSSTSLTATPAARRLRLAGGYAAVLWAVLVLPIGWLNPLPRIANSAELDPEVNAVRFRAPGLVRSPESPHELYTRLVAAGAMTLDMSVTPADIRQGGPARIVSSSAGASHRNFTIGQEGDALVVRIRTENTDRNAAEQQIDVESAFRSGQRRHIIVAYDGTRTHIYIDGLLRFRGQRPSGSFSNWNFAYPLLLGNEVGGQRPWLGTIHRLAIYDRVRHPFNAIARPPQSLADGPLVQYTFGSGDTTISNEGTLSTKAHLRLSETMETELDQFLPSFTTPRSTHIKYDSGTAVLRYSVHSLLYLPLSFLLYRAGILANYPRTQVAALLAGAVLLSFAIEFVRFVDGRDTSFYVVLAAGLGTIVGTVTGRRLREPALKIGGSSSRSGERA